MKNLIRWEDGVGCGVRGSAWFNCLQAWKEKSESIRLHVDLENPFFSGIRKVKNMWDVRIRRDFFLPP